MKKRLLSCLAAALLLCGLTAPAGAWESPPQKYRTFQQYLDFYHAQTDEDTKALTEYIEDRLAEGWADSFDANAYFQETMAHPVMGITKENWFEWQLDGYDEACFHAEMLNTYLTKGYSSWRDAQAAQQKEARFQVFLQNYPEQYAAFDPYAWFEGYYGHSGAVLETYMTNWSLDAEGFKREMFLEWADKVPTGFFNDLCVTVNGTPIQFQLYRGLDGEIAVPRAEHDRVLIPLRAIAEALGLEVEWTPETDQVTCAGAGTAVTFTLDGLEYSGGTLDAVPFAENGVTYLPLRALGEALGCEVDWNQDFATAALTTSN